MAPRPKRSLSRRVFLTVFYVALAVIVVFTVAGTVYLQKRLAGAARAELANETEVVAAALDDAASDTELLSRLTLNQTRITLIATDGTVTYDSVEDAASLPNHKNRPEVSDAFKTGHGSIERSSSTLGEVMLYEAELLKDGSVVRLAQQQAGFITVFLTDRAGGGARRARGRGVDHRCPTRVPCHHRAAQARRPGPSTSLGR